MDVAQAEDDARVRLFAAQQLQRVLLAADYTAVRMSGGRFIAVSEEEIITAQQLLASREGVFAEVLKEGEVTVGDAIKVMTAAVP